MWMKLVWQNPDLNKSPVNYSKDNIPMDIVKQKDINKKESFATKETPEQVTSHLVSIINSLWIKEMLSDKLLSQEEIKKLQTTKMSEYEYQYFIKWIDYISRVHPSKINVILKEIGLKEIGLKKFDTLESQIAAINNIENQLSSINIELPDWRIKSAKNIIVEMNMAFNQDSETKNAIKELKKETIKAWEIKEQTKDKQISTIKSHWPKLTTLNQVIEKTRTATELHEDLFKKVSELSGTEFFKTFSKEFTKLSGEEKKIFISSLADFPEDSKLLNKAKEAYLKLNPKFRDEIKNLLRNEIVLSDISVTMSINKERMAIIQKTLAWIFV